MIFNVETLQLKFYTILLSVIVFSAVMPMAFAATVTQNIVKSGDYVTLTGEGIDPDEDSLTIEWKQTGGEAVKLSSTTDPEPSFVAPEVENGKVKILTFELRVTDPYGGTDTDIIKITVMPRNQPPTADAGPDQSVEKGDEVTLQGDGFDPDGDPLIYHWSQIDGPIVDLDDPNSQTPTFDTSTITRSTATLRFQLTVADGFGGIARDAVVIKMTAGKPTLITASAGSDQTVNEGSNVQLSGSCNDKLNRETQLSWSQTLGPFVLLSSTSDADPTFVAPEIPNGSIIPTAFRLTCYVEGGGSATDIVIVRVKPINDDPSADAGPDKNTLPRRLVYLTGSGSDPDGDILKYSWKQTKGTTVELINENRPELRILAPEVSGGASTSLEFELTVTDPYGGSDSDKVTVSVMSDNVRASADAGVDQVVDEQTEVTLSGSGSDPDSDVLTYSWKQIGGEAVELSAVDQPQPTFTAPVVANGKVKVLVFELRVADENGYPSKDTVKVTVLPVNTPPTVDAGSGQEVDFGAIVVLSGSAFDEDDDPLTFLWNQVSGPSVTMSTNTELQTSFTAPKVAVTTQLTFQLIANDGQADSEPSTVTITVKGEETKAISANAGPDQTVEEHSTVTLSGSGKDPLRHKLSYSWKQITGETVTLSSTTLAKPSFEAPEVANGQKKILTFELTVTDPSTGRTAKDMVTVTVTPINGDPTAIAKVKSVREPI